MNIKEKLSYLDCIVDTISSNTEVIVTKSEGVYVDSRFFNDNCDTEDITVPMYLVYKDKPKDYVVLEQTLNAFTGSLVLFILGELEFINNFQSCCTKVV